MLPIETAHVDTTCTTTCPAGQTNFVLQGDLAYVPLYRQLGFKQRTAATLEFGGDTSIWPDFGFGMGSTLLRMLVSPQTLLILNNI